MAQRVTCVLYGVTVRGPRRVPVGEWNARRGTGRRAPRRLRVWAGRGAGARPAGARHQARALAFALRLYESGHHQPAALPCRLQLVYIHILFNSCLLFILTIYEFKINT